jgi:hypothetical protein
MTTPDRGEVYVQYFTSPGHYNTSLPNICYNSSYFIVKEWPLNEKIEELTEGAELP